MFLGDSLVFRRLLCTGRKGAAAGEAHNVQYTVCGVWCAVEAHSCVDSNMSLDEQYTPVDNDIQCQDILTWRPLSTAYKKHSVWCLLQVRIQHPPHITSHHWSTSHCTARLTSTNYRVACIITPSRIQLMYICTHLRCQLPLKSISKVTENGPIE